MRPTKGTTYSKLAKKARADLREGMGDTGCPALEEKR
jgi:hypothetical protein